MSHIGTYFSPSCIYITIGKFYKVERILNITIQVANSDMSLRVTILILTGQSAIQNRKRCRPHFLGQQEVFIKSQSVALVIIREETVGKRILPAILIQRTILYRTYRLLPVITGCQIRPFHNTTAGETEDSRMNICQRLGQIFTKSVFMPFPGIYRKKRNVFQIYGSFRGKENAEHCFRICGTGFQNYLIFFPFF